MAIREKKYEGETLYACDRCPFDTFEKDRAEAHKDEPHKTPAKAKESEKSEPKGK
jgi:hypothetical protein